MQTAVREIFRIMFSLIILCKCYVPCRSYPGPGFGSGRARSSDRCGFSERVAVPTCLLCPGFSRSEGLAARSDGERSRGARRLRVRSGQYFMAMLFNN